MDFYDRLKRFLGFPAPQESPQRNFPERNLPPEEPSRDQFDAPFHGGFSRNFNIFTDPLEIHKFFEQQMDEMLKNFGFNEFGDGFGNKFGVTAPEIEEEDLPAGSLRDQFLKSGVEKAVSGEKQDGDIDGKLDIMDWDSVFKGERAPTPKSYFFGQSVISKTVRNSDGSIETHRTIRDNDGNEETTISHKMGDKEYSVTKKRDKNGKEETIENLINMDEKDVGKFFPTQQEKPTQLDQTPWSLFDKFFK